MKSDSPAKTAAAIDVQGTTSNLVIRRNLLKETRGAAKRVGIRLAKDTKDIRLEENKIEGFAVASDYTRK